MDSLASKYEPEPNSGCWLWLGSRTMGGYGKIKVQRRTRLAHRIVYGSLVGAIPSGLTLDHLCRNRLCVNPAHLEPVSIRENTLRGQAITARAAQSFACPRGHHYDMVDSAGRRGCRQCRRESWRRYRARRRQALGPASRVNGPAAVNAAKTTCPRGHAYDAMYANRRYCMTCRRESDRLVKRRKRALGMVPTRRGVPQGSPAGALSHPGAAGPPDGRP